MSPNSAYIYSILSEAIATKNSAAFVVSGGSSPIKIFQELSNSDLDWSKVTITLVDDRAVDKNHNDSNEKLLNEYWENIDPFDAAGQFCDKGKSYRSVIFFNDKKQKDLIKTSFKKIEKEIRSTSVNRF